MENILLENLVLSSHIQTLQDEAENILRCGLSTATRFTLLLRLIRREAPTTPQSDAERKHFARATARNVQQA